jgi:hypothetical protein
MPSLAKVYIAVIAALSTAVLVVAASRWNLENLGHFVLFLRAGDGGLGNEDPPARFQDDDLHKLCVHSDRHHLTSDLRGFVTVFPLIVAGPQNAQRTSGTSKSFTRSVGAMI